MSQILKHFLNPLAPFCLLLILSVAATAAPKADFDRDGKADFAMFQPSTGLWSSHSSIDDGAFSAFKWGRSTDVLVPADYDGDGITDGAVWRPENGTWYIRTSSNEGFMAIAWGMTTIHPTGGLADVPVPADYDGDGKDDIAVWRPDTGEWFILTSTTGFNAAKAQVSVWGKLGDQPVQADYDGDGRADIAVFRGWQNRWYIIQSKTGSWQIRDFGQAGDDLLVPADYTGDGKADIAVYRKGTWFVLNSKSGVTEPFEMGFADAVPVPADYDGDGQTDFAVYRSGVWYVYESARPKLRTLVFGKRGDVPVISSAAKPGIVAVP